MRIRISDEAFSGQSCDLAACFAYEGDRQPRGVDDPALRRELSAQMKREKFEGRKGDRLVWNASDGYGARRFLVVGLGNRSDTPGEAVRIGCAHASRRAAEFSASSLALRIPPVKQGQLGLEARAAVEGAILGSYRFDRYLTDPARRETPLEQIQISTADGKAGLARAVALGEIGGRAVCLARDLVNEGPSSLTPLVMARRAVREAKAAGLQARIIGPTELKKIGMTALLSVSLGSEQRPQVVHLIYRPKGKRPRRRVVLVGKGVTFDSGGLNLKPGDHMRTMKCDMAGAAAVLAAMTVLPEIRCKSEVHGLLGLTENMTGGMAYKPGDILETLSGKTVEVGNTDAEGRLVMCDLLTYAARRLEPSTMLDVATLTGACVIALGTLATGVFSRHDKLSDALIDAGTRAGEKLWPLPMYEEYLQLLQKGPADLVNVGGRWGGAITAALFLGEFVPRELPWAHLDIAGPAFTEVETPEAREGATGSGVRTLVRWLENR